MRNWTSLVAAMCLIALPAQARNVAVRSGEHDGFTRLVIYAQPNDTVNISTSDEGYLLALASDISGYDLTRAYDLIDRSRIRALIATGGGNLAIQQGCDCHLQEFRLPTGELVVDIIDGPDPNTQAGVADDSPSRPTDTSSPSADINIELQRASLPLLNPVVDQSELVDKQVTPSAEPTTDITGLTEETPKLDKQALLAQLSRAASQGLIDANITPPDISQISDLSEKEETTPEPPPIPHAPEQHVRMQTGVEQALGDQSNDDNPTSADHACLPDEQFDIARWGGYRPETNAPIFESASYLGEFDRPDSDLLVSHIRRKIYMTFGLEALQLLENYGDNLGDGTILRMMAEVVEHGEANSHAHWTSQLVCNTRGALWATLAQPTLRGRINTNAVLRSFSELPPHLRTHLAPVLARKFLNSGRMEVAIEVRNIAARSGRPPAGKERILDAKIDLANGQAEKAEQELTETIQTALTQTQPAISTLIESKLQNGTGISDHELSLLASVAFDRQGSEKGDTLLRLHIRALLHMGRFASAFELMNKSTNQDALLEDAGRYLLELGSDAEFLTYTITRNDWGRVSARVKLEIAKRLSELGFYEHARRHVLSGDEAPTRSEREFLAKLALLQGKPKVAIGYLAGLDSNNANILREAALQHSETPDTTASPAPSASTLSDIWQSLNTSERPIPTAVRKALTPDTPTSAVSSDTGLSTYQSILNGSSETRAALSELLDIIPSINSK
jgi:hypothetical protein